MDCFDIEIELLEVPGEPIRRRFLLAARGTTLQDLHQAIQAATGWRDSHLYRFTTVQGAPIACCEAVDEEEDLDVAEDLDVEDVLADDSGLGTMLYNYDYGDDWWVLIRSRGRHKLDERFHRRLTGGQGGWPLDDMGGPLAFRMLQRAYDKRAAKKRLKAEERELLEWAEGWEPAFDQKAAAKRFDRRLRPRL